MSNTSSSIEQFVATFKWSSFFRAKDLKKRIKFTLLVLIIYRFGTYIPLPGINPLVIKEFVAQHSGGLLGVLDMFSGGSISRMTVFALNIMPYISASIIVQLLTAISPYMASLKKEGERGKQKIGQYTRYGTVCLALVQAFGISVGLQAITSSAGAAVSDPGLFFKLSTMITLTGGTMFVMWLGERITARGIGNGSSIIIASGIIANLPQSALKVIDMGQKESIFIVLSIILCVIGVMVFVIFMEKAQRKIPIQYPKRYTSPNSSGETERSHMPLKLNIAGVIPPIFASSLLTLPMTIGAFASSEADSFLGRLGAMLGHGKPIYLFLFAGLIIFFSFFYTELVFNPKETADSLKKSGAYIPGYRPGVQTSEYLGYLLNRITVVGALYLVALCSIPEIVMSYKHLPFYFGGTSFLIVIGVTLDLINQMQSHLVTEQYKGLMLKKPKKETN